MVSGISLANKCQLLFGFAVVVILGAALAVPWLWIDSLATESKQQSLRELADAWLGGKLLVTPEPANTDTNADPANGTEPGTWLMVSLPSQAELDDAIADLTGPPEDFAQRAWQYLRDRDEETEYLETEDEMGIDVDRYARRLTDLPDREDRNGPASISADSDQLIFIIERRGGAASGKLLVSRIYLVAVWLAASLLAILLFYLILTKLIFSPVRALRVTAEKVQAGDTSTRAEIHTGDEFEELSAAFNSMLERMTEGQARLQMMNETLDLRLGELAEANFALFESNRLKGEFLASVSHELRTPLNSIIGFSELLDEMARGDAEADPKRARYLGHILGSSRSLLEMINDLLEMAKIEAGRVELAVANTNISDLLEGLLTIMRPQAEGRHVELLLRPASVLPAVETDAGKLQQVLYNFLSNAIKFTPEHGTVTITAERVTRSNHAPGVRIGVIDTGPGIPMDLQDIIFEKFRQADASHTRSHSGVGLGLAICRELAEMLGASLSVVSSPGKGAAFYVELPLVFEASRPQPLMVDPAAQSEAH
ncbi:MAG: ATP-binding protein [Phycisphaerales bacterium]